MLCNISYNHHCSLFDSINERYEKQKRNIEPHIIIQFGICTFQRVQHENKYTAEIFNFFLLPRTIPSMNRSFVWQVAALEFLSKHGFDFNEVCQILLKNFMLLLNYIIDNSCLIKHVYIYLYIKIYII